MKVCGFRVFGFPPTDQPHFALSHTEAALCCCRCKANVSCCWLKLVFPQLNQSEAFIVQRRRKTPRRLKWISWTWPLVLLWEICHCRIGFAIDRQKHRFCFFFFPLFFLQLEATGNPPHFKFRFGQCKSGKLPVMKWHSSDNKTCCEVCQW